MCIGEITPEILDSLCRTKKINQIALNLEAGSNRLLTLVGKKHTREMAIDICNKILNANPNIVIDTTVMVGLPTENFEDMLLLGDLILKCHINYVHCNYYGFSPKHPIAKYEQLTEQVRQLHLDFLIKYLKKNYDGDYILQMRHETIDDKRKRSVQREIKKIQEDQKYVLPKLLRVKVENFVGNNISIKSNDIINDENTLDKEYQKVLKNIKNSKFKSHL